MESSPQLSNGFTLFGFFVKTLSIILFGIVCPCYVSSKLRLWSSLGQHTPETRKNKYFKLVWQFASFDSLLPTKVFEGVKR